MQTMKIKSPRHGSRSSSKGRIAKSCPCGGVLIVQMSDHYNFEAVCIECGNMIDNHRMPSGISLFAINKGRR